MPAHVIAAITGASGAIYGVRLVEELLAREVRISLLVTDAGRQVMKHEIGLDSDSEASIRDRFCNSRLLRHYPVDDLFAPVASGSHAADAMIVCPCSMGTLARIAGGISGNLIERCADVMLKERRPLVLVPRETPLSDIHLENMLRLSRSGARIVPAMPAFYHHPESVADLVDFVAGRALEAAGVGNDLYRKWREEEGGNF